MKNINNLHHSDVDNQHYVLPFIADIIGALTSSPSSSSSCRRRSSISVGRLRPHHHRPYDCYCYVTILLEKKFLLTCGLFLVSVSLIQRHHLMQQAVVGENNRHAAAAVQEEEALLQHMLRAPAPAPAQEVPTSVAPLSSVSTSSSIIMNGNSSSSRLTTTTTTSTIHNTTTPHYHSRHSAHDSPRAFSSNHDDNDSNNFLERECTLLNGTRVLLFPNQDSDNNRRIQIPTFIIIGVHKGGTTALRELLQLPGVLDTRTQAAQQMLIPSTKREPHYFDWQYDHIVETLYGGSNVVSDKEDKMPAFETTTTSKTARRTLADSDDKEEERFRRGLCQVRYEYITQYFDMERFFIMPADDTNATASATTAEDDPPSPPTKPQYYSYEKTPSYIIKQGAARLIKTVFPWTKIVVSLRNPMERCLSHYRMDIERKYDNKTIEDWLAQDVDILHRLNYTLPPISTMPPTLRQAWDKIQATRSSSNNSQFNFVSPDWKQTSLLYRGFYAEQLQEWLQYYTLGQDLYIIPFERLKQHPKRVLHDLLEFLQISTTTTTYTSDSSSSSLLLEDKSRLHHDDNNDNNNNNIYHQSFSPNRGELNVTISTELQSYLRLLLKPYNDDLRNLLSSSLSKNNKAGTGAAPDDATVLLHDDDSNKWWQDMTRDWD